MENKYRTAETTINGYRVEFEFDPSKLEEGGASQCYITKGNLSGSLACLEMTGGIDDRNGDSYPVPQAIADKIIEWAYAQGY